MLEKQASEYAHNLNLFDLTEGYGIPKSDVWALVRQAYLDGYGAARNTSTDTDNELFAASTEQGIPLLLSDIQRAKDSHDR